MTYEIIYDANDNVYDLYALVEGHEPRLVDMYDTVADAEMYAKILGLSCPR